MECLTEGLMEWLQDYSCRRDTAGRRVVTLQELHCRRVVTLRDIHCRRVATLQEIHCRSVDTMQKTHCIGISRTVTRRV